MATPDQIQDEERRARQVRMIADFTCSVIAQQRMAREEAEELVRAARARILDLFPGRDETYELLYAPRFRRVLDEFSTQGGERRGVVIPFRPRSG